MIFFSMAEKTNQATDLFICLDTGGGTLGNKQLIWLENVLQGSRAEEVFGYTTYLILDALLDGDPYASYLKLTVCNGGIGYEFIGI